MRTKTNRGEQYGEGEIEVGTLCHHLVVSLFSSSGMRQVLFPSFFMSGLPYRSPLESDDEQRRRFEDTPIRKERSAS